MSNSKKIERIERERIKETDKIEKERIKEITREEVKNLEKTRNTKNKKKKN